MSRYISVRNPRRPATAAAFTLVAALIAAVSSGQLGGSAPQQVGAWASLGTVADSRIGAAAVTLPDGRALITGGTVDGVPADSVVVLDPLTRAVSAAGHMLEARVGHTATRLADGRVLIAGGVVNGVRSADVELFDPSTGESVLAGSLTQPRAGHAAAVIPGGKVLVVGGATTNDAVLDRAEIVDPATGVTTLLTARMSAPRAGASATTLIQGEVLIAGGRNAGGELASAEIYQPWTESFVVTPTSLTVPRSGHSAVLLPHNNSVLIAGGTSANAAVAVSDLFLPAEFPDPYSYGIGTFAATAPLTVARSGAIGGPAGDNGLAFVAGGGTTEAEQYRFATIKTDKDDYAPGEHAVITGSGWAPDADVTLVFQEDPAVHDDYVLKVHTQLDGTFEYRDWAPEPHDLNVRFYLLASDGRSRAQMTFTDSQPNAVTVSPGSLSVLPGASANYSVSVTMGGNSNLCTVTLSTSALPAGASASFTNSPITTNSSYSSALNIGTVFGVTPSGTYTFTVTATRDAVAANCQGSGGTTSALAYTLIVLDITPPTSATVATPANGSSFTAATVPATFAGSATDNVNGVGLAANSTTFTLQRPDTTFWNGTAWVAAPTQLATVHGATTSNAAASWTSNVAMPTWSAQPLGTYTVRARAVDKSGNVTLGSPVTFTLQLPGPTKLAFTNSSFSNTVNACFGPFNVQSQNGSGAPTNVTSPTTVNLSTSGTGSFHTDASCATAGISTRSIGTGSSATGAFYYKPATVGTGTHTLTAADAAALLTSATQNQTVTQGSQAITITQNAPATAVYNTTFEVKATGGASGNPITFTPLAGSGGVCNTQSVTSASGVFTATIKMISGIGSCQLGLNQAASADYTAAPQVTTAITAAAKVTQTIVITQNSPASAAYNTTFDVKATGGDSSFPIVFTPLAGSGGVCNTQSTTSAGGVFTATIKMVAGTGTCQLGLNQAGDDNYAAATQVTTAITTASKAPQTITVTTPAPASAVFNTSFPVAATASSSLTVAITTTGGCSILGGTVTMTSGTTACVVHYNQPGDANYEAATEVTSNTAATKAAQTITVTTPAPASAVFNTSFPVAATASSSLTVAITTTGGCSILGGTVTMTSGTTACVVHYNQAGDGNYEAATEVTSNTTATKALQTITVTTPAPPSAVFNTSFPVAATASSSLTVAITTTGGCSIAGGTVTMTSGTTACVVHYNQAGDGNYEAATEVTSNTTATKASQTITVTTPAPASAVFNTSFPVAATASSSLTVAITTTGGCSILGGTVTMTSGTTACVVHYNQAGDGNYDAATEVTSNTAATKAPQTITVTTPAPASAVFNTSFPVAATASSSLTVAITTTGGCSILGGTVTMTSGTTACVVHYNQAGDGNYEAATEVTSNTTATKASQTITVTTPAPASAVFNTTFAVAATANSSLTVAITVTGGCSIAGGTVTMTSGTNACVVHYNQAGDANYLAAPEVTATVTAVKAPQTIVVSTHAPATAVYNTGFSVAAAGGGSGNPVVISSGSLPVCTNVGAAFTMVSGTGTCEVRFNQAGDANYGAAAQVVENTAAVKASQSITFPAVGPKLFGDPDFPVNASASSGLGVAFSASGVCTVTGNVVHLTASGGCIVTAAQSGDANFSAAPNLPQTIGVTAWTLTGFYQPVDLSSTTIVWNTVKGGSTVPLKFNIYAGGVEQTSLAAILSVTATNVSCSLSPTSLDAPVETLSTGGSSLRYDATGHQFIQNWQTPRAANNCYQVIVTAADGSTINNAFFKIK